MIAEQTPPASLNLRWTFSNALSALRGLMALPIVLAIDAEARVLAIALSVFAVITDLLDGYVARKRNEISDLGKILDPLSDKIYMAAGVAALLAKGWLEPWFVAVGLGRDLLIVLGGIYITRRTGLVLPSNYVGKTAVASLALQMLLLLAGVTGIVYDTLQVITVTLLAASFIVYLKRAIETVKAHPPKAN